MTACRRHVGRVSGGGSESAWQRRNGAQFISVKARDWNLIQRKIKERDKT
jgi:hypothetical protein